MFSHKSLHDFNIENLLGERVLANRNLCVLKWVCRSKKAPTYVVQKSVSFGLLDTVAFVLQLVQKKNRSQGPVTIKIMFVPPF